MRPSRMARRELTSVYFSTLMNQDIFLIQHIYKIAKIMQMSLLCVLPIRLDQKITKASPMQNSITSSRARRPSKL